MKTVSKMIETLSRSFVDDRPRQGLLRSISGLSVASIGMLAVIAPMAALSASGGGHIKPNDCPFNCGNWSTNCCPGPTGCCPMDNGQLCCGICGYDRICCDCNNNCYTEYSCGTY